VVRVGKTKNKNAEGAVQPSVIYRRLSTIAELWENNYLQSKNIQRSGMIFRAWLLYRESKSLGKEELVQICEMYDMPKVKNGKYEFYNWSPLAEFLSIENFKKLNYEIY
jgi:hypothetical protein